MNDFRMPQLSVIIPVYNEKQTILQILEKVRQVDVNVPVNPARLLPEAPWGSSACKNGKLSFTKQIIVVDDGSTDGTREILQQEARRDDLLVLFHEQNRGKGAAVWTGWQHATGDVFLIQDADLEYSPDEYPVLLQPTVEGRSKVAYGSRFLGGGHKAMFFSHALGNRLLTFCANVLFDSNLSDMETCYKVVTREVADQIVLRSPRWGFDPELTAKVLKRGYRIFEVPITYTGREFHEGKKIGWRDAFVVLWTLVKYRFVD